MAMMRSADVTLFEIPFDTVCDVLSKFKIDFRWEEKDRDKAYKAWEAYSSLSDKQKIQIGDMLVDVIRQELQEEITKVLDNSIPRSIKDVEIEVTTNLGEVKFYHFDSVEEALKFLQEFDEEEILSTENAPSLFENETLAIPYNDKKE
jgi:hypothetical protein